jgi:hypothetical protein
MTMEAHYPLPRPNDYEVSAMGGLSVASSQHQAATLILDSLRARPLRQARGGHAAHSFSFRKGCGDHPVGGKTLFVRSRIVK